jgi:hypothetical protein
MTFKMSERKRGEESAARVEVPPISHRAVTGYEAPGWVKSPGDFFVNSRMCSNRHHAAQLAIYSG